MHNPYRGGTADVWYSHRERDHWVEYKYIARVPRRGKVVPDLSPLQLDWLVGRYKEGRDVSVVVGYPGGGVVFARPYWETGLSPKEFLTRAMDRRTLAVWIAS